MRSERRRGVLRASGKAVINALTGDVQRMNRTARTHQVNQLFFRPSKCHCENQYSNQYQEGEEDGRVPIGKIVQSPVHHIDDAASNEPQPKQSNYESLERG